MAVVVTLALQTGSAQNRAAAAGAYAADARATTPAALTIERVASLPNIGGTPPANVVWSRDGSRIAFLWNDAAMPFRDLWIASAADGALTRVTDMARAFPEAEDPQGDPDPDRALARGIERRARTGLARMPPCCLPYPASRDNPAWTPDGRGLAFAYQGAVFQINADGTGLERLLPAAGDRYALAFSPDGTYLSFLQDGDLWLLHRKSRELVKATTVAAPSAGNVPGADHNQPASEFITYTWSSNSRFVALQFEDRRAARKLLFPNYLTEQVSAAELYRDLVGDRAIARRIGIYSVTDGRARFVDLGDANDRLLHSYTWSPDGTSLLVDEGSITARDRWISIVMPGDGSAKEIWHDHRDTRTTLLATADWRSDGKAIIFTADTDGRNHLYSFDLAARTTTALTRGDWDVASESGTASVRVVRATKQVFFVSTEKNPYERQVYRIPETGGPIVQVTSLPGVHLPYVSPDGARVATIRSDDVTPRELYVTEAAGGATERRLTTSPPKEFISYPWARARYVTFKSHVDGATLHGRLIEPPDLDRTKKYAAILGPVYSNTVRNRWGDREESRGIYNAVQQYLVLEGRYIVLQVDVRGSIGHGLAFRDGLKEYGVQDIDDLQSGVEYLKTLGYVDSKRVGIWGSSYGGLMTAMSLFKKPGVYAAGVACSPATNLWHSRDGQQRVLGPPSLNPDLYRRTSAVTYGEELRDHLMIIHGMWDDIVLFQDSVALAERLMMLGKDFDLVIAPSAAHGWSRKDYTAVYMLRKLVEHFDRYLLRGPR